MKINRIVTAESESGVATRIDAIDTAIIDFLTNIWGFDLTPRLPLRPEKVLGEFRGMGIYGPPGSVRINVCTFAPETGKGPAELERAASIDMGTGAGMVIGNQGDGMHRTDSIDLAIVIDGEIDVAYPSQDGQLHEITIKAGDILVHNGTFHSWRNRSTKECLILFVIFTAERKTA